MMNKQGRPTQPGAPGSSPAPETYTGHRGLEHEEPLLFDRGSLDRSGVDVPQPREVKPRLGGLERKEPIGLPGLSEPR